MIGIQSFCGSAKAALLIAAALAAFPALSIAQEPPGAAPPPAATPPPTGKLPVMPQGPQGPQAPDRQAAGETSPEQHAKMLGELYARLATAPDEATASEIATAIEQLWQHSGSPTADLLVARATAAIEAQQRDLALKLLNAAVEMQPDFAEAWNRRAYLFYLENDYKRALGDIRRVLALEPYHYKALEGLANILQQLGEKKAALEALESLLKVNPNAAGAKKVRDELKIEVEGRGI